MALEAALLLDEPDPVAQISQRMVELWSPVTSVWHTLTDRHLGDAFAYLGQPDEARQRYDAALALAEQMQWRPEIALVRLGLAKLLLRHFVDERSEAAEHLAFAIAETSEMKMAPTLEEALRIRLADQGPTSTDPQASLVSLTTSVEADRPNVASAVAPDGTVTLLFSDIEDSTKLNVELGDDAWLRSSASTTASCVPPSASIGASR